MSSKVQILYMKALFLFLIGTLSLAGRLFAQQTKTDSLYSNTLHERRVLQVVLPEGYKPVSTEKYDVLYVLDGEGGTTDMAGMIAGFIAKQSFMPPIIVVGVVNVDRDRDFLPAYTEGEPTSGGAEHFLDFFQNELIPYINQHYQTSGGNTLLGHSFGGIFVTYALLNRPQLFGSYIAADPSYWWDNELMVRMAAEKMANLSDQRKTLLITGRAGQGLVEMHIPQMDTLLKHRAPAGLRWKAIVYENETHGTIKLKSFYDGLRFSYEGFNRKPLMFVPGAGVLLKDKPAPLWSFGDTTSTRYTTDGSEPSLSSKQMPYTGQFENTTKLIVKRFANQPRFDQRTSADFTVGDWLPPASSAKGLKPGGFNYACYDSKGKLLSSGRVDSTFDLQKLPDALNRLVITGSLEATEDGYYVFGVDGNGAITFSLGKQMLIDNPSGEVMSYIIPLKKGFYPLREEYKPSGKERKLELEYITPDKMNTRNSSAIPRGLQYGKL